MASPARSGARQFWGWLLIVFGVLWLLMAGGCACLGFGLAQEGQKTLTIPWAMLVFMAPVLLIGVFAVLGGRDLLRKARTERDPEVSTFD